MWGWELSRGLDVLKLLLLEDKSFPGPGGIGDKSSSRKRRVLSLSDSGGRFRIEG